MKKVVYDGGDETNHARVLRDIPGAYTWLETVEPCKCRGMTVFHPTTPHSNPIVVRIRKGDVLEFDPDDGSSRTAYILGHLAHGQAHEVT